MKLKQLILTAFFVIQAIVSSTALAWSPLQQVEDAVEKMQYCYFTVASGDEGQGAKKTEGEEEEEPECD
ncbi:MAG: hypothetical protein JSU67_08295 [Gammaproteobacteria bacterium]|nr:MAG: hypothetical protein JSU67_08295 [Gammaproteobacteria bacterium]